MRTTSRRRDARCSGLAVDGDATVGEARRGKRPSYLARGPDTITLDSGHGPRAPQPPGSYPSKVPP